MIFHTLILVAADVFLTFLDIYMPINVHVTSITNFLHTHTLSIHTDMSKVMVLE